MTPKALLIGNGIYRAFHGEEESWNSVLKHVKECFVSEGIPLKQEPYDFPSFILYFEYLYAMWAKYAKRKKITEDKSKKKKTKTKKEKYVSFVAEVGKFLSEKYDNEEFKTYASIVNRMVWGHFDVVLTTNIDNRFEQIIEEKWDPVQDNIEEYDSRGWEGNSNHKWKYSTYRRKYKDGKTLFYLHGDLNKENSICFGLDHYLGEYRCQYECLYADEKDVVDETDKENAKVRRDWLSRGQNESNLSFESWLDYFFFNDVDIVGLALDRVEVDLWWAIEKRAQYRFRREADGGVAADKKKINTIRYFYPSCELEKKDAEATTRNMAKIELLRSMDVVPVVIPCCDYREFYKIYFDDFAGDNRCQK